MDTKQYDPKTMSWDDIRDVVAATTLQMKETDRQIKETDRQIKETDRQMKETKQRLDEFIRENQRLREESDRKFRELATQFTSEAGHIIEGMMEPSVFKMFLDAGYDIDRCWKNYKTFNKASNRRVEVDLLLLNHSIVIPVEVKVNCTCRHIDHYIEQMRKFRDICTEFADKDILLAIAGVNFEREADLYALEQGLFVIRISNSEIFSLEKPKKVMRIRAEC